MEGEILEIHININDCWTVKLYKFKAKIDSQVKGYNTFNLTKHK